MCEVSGQGLMGLSGARLPRRTCSACLDALEGSGGAQRDGVAPKLLDFWSAGLAGAPC